MYDITVITMGMDLKKFCDYSDSVLTILDTTGGESENVPEQTVQPHYLYFLCYSSLSILSPPPPPRGQAYIRDTAETTWEGVSHHTIGYDQP